MRNLDFEDMPTMPYGDPDPGEDYAAYADDEIVHPPARTADRLAALAEELRQVREQIQEGKEREASLKAREKELSETVIPSVMDEIGATAWEGQGGVKIKLSRKVVASIPKGDPERAERCYAWIAEKGGEHLIKTQVVVEFGKGERLEALQYAAKCPDERTSLVSQVHPQTLGAFVRKRMEEGVALCEDLSVYDRTVAELK